MERERTLLSSQFVSILFRTSFRPVAWSDPTSTGSSLQAGVAYNVDGAEGPKACF